MSTINMAITDINTVEGRDVTVERDVQLTTKPGTSQKNKKKKSVQPTDTVPDDCIVRLNFNERFSLMQNIEFTNKVADADKILFDRVLYAVCDDISTAEKVRLDSSRVKLEGNRVVHSRRLGPAHCAFMSKAKKDPKVLTLCRLSVDTTYAELKKRFPEALDIATRRTMAKVVFSSALNCEAAYYEAQDMKWRGSCIPSFKWYSSHDQDSVEDDLEEDPEVALFSHPRQFALAPHVVAVTLESPLELKSQMALLEAVQAAKDIVLSKFCRVVYSSPLVTWQRRKELGGLALAGGGRVMAWANGAVLGAISKGTKRRKDGSDSSGLSRVEEDASSQPSAKKMKLVSEQPAKELKRAKLSPGNSAKKLLKGSKKMKPQP